MARFRLPLQHPEGNKQKQKKIFIEHRSVYDDSTMGFIVLLHRGSRADLCPLK